MLGATYCFASSPRAFEGFPEGGLVGLTICAAAGAGLVVMAKREVMHELDEMTIAQDVGWGPGPGSDTPIEKS